MEEVDALIVLRLQNFDYNISYYKLEANIKLKTGFIYEGVLKSSWPNQEIIWPPL